MIEPIVCETNDLIKIALPIGTFIGGFLVSRLTLSKKDKLDHKQRLYENANNLADAQEKAYKEFTSYLGVYIKADNPTIDMFMDISSSGDNYFRQLKLTSEAIMSEVVDRYIRDQTLLPLLKEAVEKTLPTYYEVLNNISLKKNFGYSGELKRSNYETIYSVVEKYT